MSLQRVVLLQVWFVLNLVGLTPIHGVAIGERDLRTCRSRLRRSTGSSAFTAEEAQAIVDKHNEFRSQVNPEAANMRFMNWDYPLADMAQQYAEMCIWDHGQAENNTSSFSPIGQNLWIGGGVPHNPPSGVSSTQAWYNEFKNFDYTTDTCAAGKQCGHYTQVVWAKSYAIGCGRHFCETAEEPSKPDKDPKTNVWITVCNYGLAGNYNNQKPYVAGPSCTKCSSGSGQCYNRQCRACSEHNEECVCKQVCKNCGVLDEENCTCACQTGFEGVDCSNKCENRHRYCGKGWYPKQCRDGYEPAIKNCPLMCGSCVAADANYVCDETSD